MFLVNSQLSVLEISWDMLSIVTACPIPILSPHPAFVPLLSAHRKALRKTERKINMLTITIPSPNWQNAF